MSNQKLLKTSKLYDGIQDDIQENVDILIEGERIVAVGKDLSHNPDAEVIDLTAYTVTPGLIDAHIHSDIVDWHYLFSIHSDAYYALSHLHTAQRTLERGFTTIRCHGVNARDYGIVDVKKMINQGLFAGSRMHVAAHMLGTPGGHADGFGQMMSVNPAIALANQSPNIGSGPDFFRNAVRNEAKFGSDFVKLFVTGGFATPNDGPEDEQVDEEEIAAFLNTANAVHKPSTAHVYMPKTMQTLMKYHITGCEHGSLMDEETARMFEQTGTYLVPTFCPYDEIIRGDEENLKKKSPEFQKKLLYYGKQLKESRQIIIDSKIKLGYGTDFVAVHQCWESWHEYESWMLSGIDPFRILKAATKNNAEILFMDKDIGTIEPGKFADISAWHRDLLTDPKALSECDFVMKGGVVYPTVYSTD